MLKSWNLSQARSHGTAWLWAAGQVRKELWGLPGGAARAAVPPGCSALGRDGHEGEGKRSPHRNTSSSNWSPHADDQPDLWPTDPLDLVGGITASGDCLAGVCDTRNLGEGKGGGKGGKAKQPTSIFPSLVFSMWDLTVVGSIIIQGLSLTIQVLQEALRDSCSSFHPEHVVCFTGSSPGF